MIKYITTDEYSIRYRKTTSSRCKRMDECRGNLLLFFNILYNSGADIDEKSAPVNSSWIKRISVRLEKDKHMKKRHQWVKIIVILEIIVIMVIYQ